MERFEHQAARFRRQLAAMPAVDLEKMIFAALQGHTSDEQRSCEAAVKHLSGPEHDRVVGLYGVRNAWRFCATSDLQVLIDVLGELIRRADREAGIDAASSPVDPEPRQIRLPIVLDQPTDDIGGPL